MLGAEEQPSPFHKDFPQVQSELAWLNQPSGDASRASASASYGMPATTVLPQTLLGGQRYSAQDSG